MLHVFFALISAGVATIYSFLSGSFSVALFACVFWIGGAFFSFYGIGRREGMGLFFISFSMYLSLALLSCISYQNLGEFYVNIDQSRFLADAERFSQDSYWVFAKGVLFDDYGFWKDIVGYELLMVAVGRIAVLLGCQSSIFLQKLLIVFLASLISPGIYRILRFYVSPNRAFLYSLVYALCSYVVPISYEVLRDIPVAFIYVLGIYIAHKSFTGGNLIKIFLLFICAWLLRPESGLLFLGVVAIFFYFGIQGKNKDHWYVLAACCGCVLLLLCGNTVFSSIRGFHDVAVGYNDFTAETSYIEKGAVGQVIASLPMGIRNIVLTGYSLFPIVPAVGYTGRVFSFDGIPSFLDIWMVVSYLFATYIATVCVWRARPLIALVKRNKWFLVWGGYFLMFVFLNTFNFSARRVVALYPVLFVFFVVLSDMPLRQKGGSK